MVICAVLGCKNTPDKKNIDKILRFHYFPKDVKLCKLWINATGNTKKFSLKNSRICSEHFVESDYRLEDILLNIPNHKRILLKNAVPSVNLPIEPRESSSREKRHHERVNKEIIKECLANYEKERLASLESCCQTDSGNNSFPENAQSYTEDLSQESTSYYTNTGTQTEYDYGCMKELRIMELERENRRLKKILKKKNQQAQKDEALRSSVREIFTPNQVRKLESHTNRPRWITEDISLGMTLYSASPRAYRLLRKQNLPLPGPSTLHSWAHRLKVRTDLTDSSQEVCGNNNMEINEEEHCSDNNLVAQTISKDIEANINPEVIEEYINVEQYDERDDFL